MIKDNHTKTPEIPRAAAVWKKILSFSSNSGVVSVIVGTLVVVFEELSNVDKLDDMETQTNKWAKQIIQQLKLYPLNPREAVSMLMVRSFRV